MNLEEVLLTVLYVLDILLDMLGSFLITYPTSWP